MTESTIHVAQAAISVSGDASPAPADIVALEHQGRRHQENLEGLRRTEQYHEGEIARFDAELVTLRDGLAHLPANAGALETYGAKLAVIEVEANRGVAAEELGRLQPQILETTKLIVANKKAIAAARVP
jgi:hypothetical protein